MSLDSQNSDHYKKHNTARYFVENQHVAWALLIFVIIWGAYSYLHMPKRKDPNIPVRVAMITTTWPGHDAMQVEGLVTKAVESKIAENSFLQQPNNRKFSIKSLTLPGVSMVQVQLAPGTNRDIAFNELSNRLADINDSLPQGAGPIKLDAKFGDTSAVMLSIASPRASDVEIHLRAKDIAGALEKIRSQKRDGKDRAAIVIAAPLDVDPVAMQSMFRLFGLWLVKKDMAKDIELLSGPGFMGIDFATSQTDKALLDGGTDFLFKKFGATQFSPDAWEPVVLRGLSKVEAKLKKVAGAKYSYRQLNDFSESITANLKTIPQVSRVLRSGVLQEQVDLSYSQDILAAYGVVPAQIKQVISQRNTLIPAGVLQTQDMNTVLEFNGAFKNISQIGDLIVTNSKDGTPVYLRSIVNIRKGYQDPPRLLSYYTTKSGNGAWQRNRCVNVCVQMHAGEQIGELGKAVQAKLAKITKTLPDDLIIGRVSDQPTQVAENIDLFMGALYEAILIVVLIALIGFWEWRSAFLLMLSIPITLAMTFGFMYILGINLQQVSIAALIIALGLLVDDPVVANDAIKQQMALGKPRKEASWLGPTLLATAILFATITNIVAYLPFLMLSGNTGDFLYSLPMVITCSLVSSRIVSMTFVPQLASLLLKPDSKKNQSMEERRTHGLTGKYYRFMGYAIDHRKMFLLGALVIIILGFAMKSQLKTSFFPHDVQYLSTVDIRLKNDANLPTTNRVAKSIEKLVRKEAKRFAEQVGYEKPDDLLKSITTTVGGGAPRFWFSVTPEQRQSNYAQLIVRLSDKNLTPQFAPALQAFLSTRVVGADIDVKQLQTNPVTYPVAIRISSKVTPGSSQELQEIKQLREYADKVKNIIRKSPWVRSVRDDWGKESFVFNIDVDEQRASMAGLTNQDIAMSSGAGISGTNVGTLRQGDKQIPIVARLRLDQRANIQNVENLYVYSSKNETKVPLMSVANTHYGFQTERIRRLEQFRTITVMAYPANGALPSQVMADSKAGLAKLKASLPDGYQINIAGEQASQVHGFANLVQVLMISAMAIFLALVFQFKSLIKPFLVFAAVPFGMGGAMFALWIMNKPFSFMAFLGMVSLVGVIVSHIIVLFDYIEICHEAGEPVKEALIDAGLMRLRPILITIGATAIALVPLANEGGPLWEGLCYAQIGGLIFATFGTLLFVPTLYAFVVFDLKWIRWDIKKPSPEK
ncbi:MAG: efflux RND transporter permease subunit [Desulfobacteraceae bacterium]|nr:efflux RND transporter permease subunit [Desulfobacteraceae bacterium]